VRIFITGTAGNTVNHAASGTATIGAGTVNVTVTAVTGIHL
jgi:hypothetical protein